MKLEFRVMTPQERLYAYSQSQQIGGQTGSVGFLCGAVGMEETAFSVSWEREVPSQSTPAVKEECNKVMELLRFDERCGGLLKDRTTMAAYCSAHPESRFESEYRTEYGFRADTKDHTYLIRCIPDGEYEQFYLYPYRRDWLEHHMERAKRGIRFITPHYKEKFRVPDGDTVRIITKGGEYRDRVARYIDETHLELVGEHGSNLYHICEFAERLEQSGCQRVIPLRSSLPHKCFSVMPSTGELIILEKGKSGYTLAGASTEGKTVRESADILNDTMGVSKAQEAAMLAGSMFGFDTLAADPKNYDQDGQPIKPKHRYRGDAR